jgi:hypothetical protein
VGPPVLGFYYYDSHGGRHWSGGHDRGRDGRWSGHDRGRDGRWSGHDRVGQDRGDGRHRADAATPPRDSASTAVPFVRGPEAPEPGAVRQGP